MFSRFFKSVVLVPFQDVYFFPAERDVGHVFYSCVEGVCVLWDCGSCVCLVFVLRSVSSFLLSLSYRSGVGNVRPAGRIRPAKSFGLALPRQPQAGLETQ